MIRHGLYHESVMLKHKLSSGPCDLLVLNNTAAVLSVCDMTPLSPKKSGWRKLRGLFQALVSEELDGLLFSAYALDDEDDLAAAQQERSEAMTDSSLLSSSAAHIRQRIARYAGSVLGKCHWKPDLARHIYSTLRLIRCGCKTSTGDRVTIYECHVGGCTEATCVSFRRSAKKARFNRWAKCSGSTDPLLLTLTWPRDDSLHLRNEGLWYTQDKFFNDPSVKSLLPGAQAAFQETSWQAGDDGSLVPWVHSHVMCTSNEGIIALTTGLRAAWRRHTGCRKADVHISRQANGVEYDETLVDSSHVLVSKDSDATIASKNNVLARYVTKGDTVDDLGSRTMSGAIISPYLSFDDAAWSDYIEVSEKGSRTSGLWNAEAPAPKPPNRKVSRQKSRLARLKDDYLIREIRLGPQDIDENDCLSAEAQAKSDYLHGLSLQGDSWRNAVSKASLEHMDAGDESFKDLLAKPGFLDHLSSRFKGEVLVRLVTGKDDPSLFFEYQMFLARMDASAPQYREPGRKVLVDLLDDVALYADEVRGAYVLPKFEERVAGPARVHTYSPKGDKVLTAPVAYVVPVLSAEKETALAFASRIALRLLEDACSDLDSLRAWVRKGAVWA